MTRYILAPLGVNPLEEPIAERKRNTEWLFYAAMVLLMLAGGGVSWWWMTNAQAVQAQAAHATGTMLAAASANPAEPTSTITPAPTETFIPTVTPTATGLLDVYFKVKPSGTPVLAGALTPMPTTTPEPPMFTAWPTQKNNPPPGGAGGGGSTVIIQTRIVEVTVVVQSTPMPTGTPRVVVITATPGPTQTPWVVTATETSTPTQTPVPLVLPFIVYLPLVIR